jgi:Clp amino terminal domain, pathogenicity island component
LTSSPTGRVWPFSSRRKKPGRHHDSIGTEHILLGLIREGNDVAAGVPLKLDADHYGVRQRVPQRQRLAAGISA